MKWDGVITIGRRWGYSSGDGGERGAGGAILTSMAGAAGGAVIVVGLPAGSKKEEAGKGKGLPVLRWPATMAAREGNKRESRGIMEGGKRFEK